MSTRILKITTGKLLAWGVALHSQAIRAHLKRSYNAMIAASKARVQAHDDLNLARRQFGEAIGVEWNAVFSYQAAHKAAEVELSAAPSVSGYSGAVRAATPFGAQPQVIDKRK